MELQKLFQKREELLQLSCSFPVGTLDWERCRRELDQIDACILMHMDEHNPDHEAIFRENVRVDELIEDVFGIQIKFGKCS